MTKACPVCQKVFSKRSLGKLSASCWRARRYCSLSCARQGQRGPYWDDIKAYHRDYVRKHLKSVFSQARGSARSRGLTWTLDYETFADLRLRPCFYCGSKLSNLGIALDRLDNSAGYELNNIVPCCPQCNVWKSNTFTPGETYVAMQAVNKFRQEYYHGSLA